jgi:hypothetical protein
MILVDTSIWIDHLRRGNRSLVRALESEQVLTHPFVIGELACGNLSDRDQTLMLLGNLPKAVAADQREVLEFIGSRRLMGRGLGYVDINLLASTLISPNTQLWTADKKLAATAEELHVGYLPR